MTNTDCKSIGIMVGVILGVFVIDTTLTKKVEISCDVIGRYGRELKNERQDYADMLIEKIETCKKLNN